MSRSFKITLAVLIWFALMMLLFALRPYSPHSKDTQELVFFIEFPIWYWYVRWPITHLACIGIHRGFGWSGLDALSLWSSMAGALFLMTLAPIARRSPLILLVLVSSVTLTLNGHAEVYAWPFLFLLWFLLLGPLHLEGRVRLTPIVSIFCLGCLFHMVLVFYTPALVWLALRGRQRALARGENHEAIQADLTQALLRGVIFILIVAIMPVVMYDVMGGLNNDFERLVPLMPLENLRSDNQLLFFRPDHLAAISIFLLFSCPVGLPLALMRLRRARENDTLRFTALCAVCGVIFLVIWHPDMGWWGDWDLFSHTGLVINVLAWRLWRTDSSLAPGNEAVIRSDSPTPGKP